MGKIVAVAKTYLGKKEKPGNSGFVDPVMEAEMKAQGWLKGNAWCATVAKLWTMKAYPDRADLSKLFSASATATFAKFKKAGYEISPVPVVDAIVVWQRMNKGVGSWQGHVGVVSKVVNQKEFYSIEGNTNAAGGREGDTVAEKLRRVAKVETGLQVLGFIIIK